MKNTSHKPDVSGVPEEIQENIKTDLKAAALPNRASLTGARIGISVSDNEELEVLGYSQIHLRDFMIELVRHLMINGATIVYGGNLQKEGFTYLFAELALQYRRLNDYQKMCFENYFSYPIHTLLTEADEVHFKRHKTKIVRVPYEGGGTVPTKYFVPKTTEQRLIWASSLTTMRREMITHTDARILVGGKVSGYFGKMPGVIEEAKMALMLDKPLYLIGYMGGASQQVIEAIEGKGFRYAMNNDHRETEYEAFKMAYNGSNAERIDPDSDAIFFNDVGVEGLAQRNGLSQEENRRLFVSSNIAEIVYYIFTGLKATRK